ncbi:hypothetical protein D3C77_369260 [compost metagenome]
MLGQFAQEFVAAHGRLVQLHALVAVTLSDLFAPHEDPGPDALRTGVAAPHPASEHGDEEQAEGGNDQQAGQQDEILRPDGGTEDVELALGQVPPDRLVLAPVQPHRAEIQQEQDGAAGHAQIAEQAGEGPGVDFFPRGVEIDAVFVFIGRRGDIMYWNLLAHH